MDLQRQEYPALLAALHPEQAIDVLNNRVALIGQVNASIADFLQERRKIEERYAADLRRLARRPQQDSGAALGVFQLPWQRIISVTEDLAQSHETLASKIETDVELPLKQYATKNREMQSITTIQGNLVSIAKDWTRAKDKADKLNAKGSKKAGDASSSVDDATREWESQSPFVFEQLQALDEHRVNHLRDVLTQFQTHEVDQVERNRASAESCLNALLNIETADEIKTFAVKIQQGGNATLRRPSVAASETRPASSGNVPPMPPPPRNQDPRLRSGPSEDRLAPVPEVTPQKSKMGGLKRLGTVMRRKSAAPPPPQSAEKKKEKTRSMMPFRRGDSSRSFQDLEETGRDLTPITSRGEQESIAPVPSIPETPRTKKPAAEPPISASPNGEQVNTSKDLPLPLIPDATPAAQNAPPAISQLPFEATSTTTDNDVFAPTTSEAVTSGFDSEESARNLRIRDQPIQEDAGEAQLAMNNMASQLRMQAQNSNMNRAIGSVRGRRDVRNTMFLAGNQDIPGLSQFSNGSSANPASTGASNLSSVPPSTVTAQTVPTSSTLDATPVKRSGTGMASLDENPTLSDSTSIHSAQSLTTIAHHPELHQPGLNASIVETISTWFSETGITKSFVVGEIAFAYVNDPHSTPQEQEAVRLENFQVLERVAANPTFVTAIKSATATAEEQAGTYTISLPAIRRSIPTVGLKYQLHLNDTSIGNYSPVLITPAWQIVPGQASVIVMYSLNPAFKTTSIVTGEITLKNVAISVNLDTRDASAAKPTSAMMAPTQGAAFRRKAGAVTWRFPELKINAQQERLLVRFMVDGLAKQGGIEIKFELPETTVSNLGVEKASETATDPFADSATTPISGWTTVPTRRLTVSGKYTA